MGLTAEGRDPSGRVAAKWGCTDAECCGVLCGCAFSRHPTKDETFVLLKGKVRVTTHKDDGSVIESVILCPEEGRYGVNIPKGVWHTLESLAENSCLFECKEGPFVPHEEEGILEIPKK